MKGDGPREKGRKKQWDLIPLWFDLGITSTQTSSLPNSQVSRVCRDHPVAHNQANTFCLEDVDLRHWLVRESPLRSFAIFSCRNESCFPATPSCKGVEPHRGIECGCPDALGRWWSYSSTLLGYRNTGASTVTSSTVKLDLSLVLGSKGKRDTQGLT